MSYCSAQGKRPCIFKGRYRKIIKSRVMRWADMLHVWGQERCVQDLVGRAEGKRPLGRLRRRWEDNTKVNDQEE
jgi:hypothetical protein